MKQAKRPTLEQKKIMQANGLNWKNWMVVKDTESYLYLIAKSGKQRRCITKYVNKRDRY